MMRRDTLFGMLFVTVGLLAAGAAALLIVTEVRTARASRTIEEVTARTDRLLETGDLESASAALAEGAGAARTREHWLSLSKRAYRIAARSGDWALAADLARRGARRVAGDLDLQTVAVHSALRAGNPDAALELLSGVPHTTRLDALRAEALIANGESPSEPVGQFDVLADLSRTAPAADFAAAFELTGAEAFAVDEALRRAESGDLEAANAAITERGLTAAYPVLAAYLAYDLEDYERYESLLREMAPAQAVSAGQLMLQADIAMLRGRRADAAAVYRDLRESAPAFSSQQYLNGAWLLRDTPQQALAVLEERDGRFESDTGIARAEVMLVYPDDPEAARELLSARTEAVADPVVLETLAMHLFERRRGSVRGVVSRLWTLVNRYPDEPRPLRYLGWYLVSAGDWSELAVVADRAERLAPGVAGLYRGILAVRRTEIGRARELFETEAGESWHAAYNAGLAAMSAGYPGSANDHFGVARRRLETAVTAADGSGAPVPEQADADRARILTAEGRAYAARGDFTTAYRRVAEAVALDPDNVRARYLQTSFAERLE